ncbi:MAG: phage holin [Clostridia bacterium]|nr:phage holin [Clostridia bacterium]
MKINWKVRLKNPVFWVTVTPALITLVYTILGLLGVVPGIDEDVVTQLATALISALTTIGILVDPTTAGLNDSARAMEYDVPKGDTHG